MPNNLVCPADYTQSGDTCTKTSSTTVSCKLLNDSSNAYDKNHSCYGEDGNIIKPRPVPAAASSGNSSTAAPKKPFNFRTQCSDVLKRRHSNLVANIKDLQNFERKQFNKLQALQTSKVSPEDQSTIITEINQISSLRQKLFTELKLLLTQEQCSLSNDRYDLADQLSMLEITEQEMNNMKNSSGSLKQAHDDKLRMVEITNYEVARYNSHKTIFKNIAFCSLGVLISVYLIKKGYKTFGTAGIVISIAAAVMLTSSKIYDNWHRNQMNWNRYNWNFNKAQLGKGYETVFQHDKNAFWKGVSQAKAGAESAENKVENKASTYLKKAKKEFKEF